MQLVTERHGVGGHRRIGDQPGLHVPTPPADRRGAANEAVQRKPVQAFLHNASVATAKVNMKR